MLRLVSYFLAAFVAAVVLTPLCRLVAVGLGVVAKPTDDRWHKSPTAMLGGVAIALPVLAGSLALFPSGRVWALPICSGLIFLVGLTDDTVSLKPATKLTCQIVVASAFLFFGYRLQWVDSLLLDSMLTILWIVGITNAVNLLDNMDGLAAGITLIAGISLLAGSVPNAGITVQSLYLALLLGSTAGFLIYNFAPASIFMGDSGSLFIGLNLAALALTTSTEIVSGSNLLSVVAVPVLAMLIPIFDTTLVTASRLLSGRRASQGGRDHSSHRLVAIGLSEGAAVRVLWTLAALGGAISVGVNQIDQRWSILLAAAFVLSMIIFAVYLSKVRISDHADRESADPQRWTPLVVNLMYKRRIMDVLLDLCLIPLAYYAAYLLRFEDMQFGVNYPYFLQSLPVVIACQLIALSMVGAHRGVWRYFGLMDAVACAKGVLLGTVSAQFAILYLYRFQSYSRAVFIIYAMLLMVMLTSARGSFRLVSEFIRRRHAVGRRVVIYGAGDAGSLAVRRLSNADRPYRILGFVDDDPLTRRSKIQGYPVLGDRSALMSLIAASAVETVVISSPLLADGRLEALEAVCAEHDVELLTIRFDFQKIVAAS